MTESMEIMAFLDGLAPKATLQAISSLRKDIKNFMNGDFKIALTILCMYDGDVVIGCVRGVGKYDKYRTCSTKQLHNVLVLESISKHWQEL